MKATCFVHIFLCLWAIFGYTLAKETKDDDREKKIYYVYRVWANTTEQFDHIITIFKSASKYHLNFWKDPVGLDIPVDIMVPDFTRRHLEDMLIVYELKYKIIIHDVRKLIIERERKNGNNDKLLLDESSTAINFNMKTYHEYENISNYLHLLETRYPSIVKIYQLGFTSEHRAIQLIKIGSSTQSSKKGIWIDAGIHAREWISITTALYFIHQLTSKYNGDNQIKEYVDKLDWYILPVANPDGYEYTRSSDDPEIRLFRKNRSPSSSGCFGVDLNRNFDFHWNEVGTSNSTCAEIYSGPTSFSEHESRAIRDFLSTRKQDVQAFITLHSYAQAIMYPFGHLPKTYPADVADLDKVGLQTANAIKSVYGTHYKVGTGADNYYEASGSSTDWAKDKMGIKYAYTIELRPEYYDENGFILHELQILPTAKETWEGVKVIADAALASIGTPRSSINSAPVVKTCVDLEDRCKWFVSLGGCFIWKDVDQRCPKSCKVCDQNE